MKKGKIEGNPYALLPFLVFVLLFLGTALITKDFSSMPVVVAILIAGLFSLTMNRKESFAKKVEVFCRGGGDHNIILMALIFILAGAFASVAEATGGVDSIVSLGTSILPANLLMVGLFVVSCFISISMGTSTGTTVAIVPIAVGVAQQTGIDTAMAVGAVIGGAMFGDNLSMISDTTIAAVRTQETNMKDKFKSNFFIVLPAAIVTALILAFIPVGEAAVSPEQSYQLITVLPYLAVLVIALLGVNVLLVLVGGIVFSGIVGLANGSFDFYGLLGVIGDGIVGMENLAIIAILISGMVEIIKHNGGITFLLNYIVSKIKTRRGAAFGIAGLVSTVDVSTGNNTVSILMSGPLAKDISTKYGIEPKRSASILDLFSCCFQGLIPYGGQMLAAAGLASISPVSIVPFAFYPMLIGISGIIAIFVLYRKRTDSASDDAVTEHQV
ncbi:Na+/H+ antiporter NhaC family protein [Sediminibacillus dalangtanensis]|uniref:Na+/H+ antiporter NhaC family protein n=1 Tax=Sediminibacillus dalangtanensis TaxID=2729421 RepID=A0ABX7VTI3_9BACI|nr:Na+/H+ antiporter NhaC family protein [Sediminibacillus dalangtanensis]QTM99115.1 Na+/H+ antiporter NhaC family protein [Sediminibacillus dalangtanensis]